MCGTASKAEQSRKYASDELQRVCCFQFHGFASAYAGLLPLARIMRVVKEPDLPHARARVRNHLTRFYGKEGILFFGALAHSGEVQRGENLADCFYLKGKPPHAATCARGGIDEPDRHSCVSEKNARLPHACVRVSNGGRGYGLRFYGARSFSE
jgi:hypothetical protein